MASLPGGCDIVISDHSHVPKVEIANDVLYLNPGSAGRRRFKLPITLALQSSTNAESGQGSLI